MPVYEYECTACEKVFEIHQSMNDRPLSVCSDCGGEVKKLVSMSAFHLKGGGWYSDGYASGGTEKKNGGATQQSSSTEKAEKTEKGSGSKESKAAPPPCQGSGGGTCKGCAVSS